MDKKNWQKKLLNIFDDLSNIFLADKTLMSSKDENENENKYKNEDYENKYKDKDEDKDDYYDYENQIKKWRLRK